MKVRSALSAFACFGLAAWFAVARADEVKVPLDKLPQAVTKAIKAKFPTGSLKQAEKEVEDGKTIYEVGLEDGGTKIDVSLKEDGTILEIEKEIPAAALPKAVSAALKEKYSKGTIKKAEEIAKGETRSFEVIVAVGNKRREVVLDPGGKILEDEESDED
ncbi:MAG: PepSY-like domain-containing protein [Isosphaeraceae bacterium]|nr:PepSY-like domain-containing protein [Isosphaeraceae bacterium]